MVYAVSADSLRVSKLLHTGPPGYLGGIPDLRIGIVKAIIITPEEPGTTSGNSITADRWAKILQTLGHAASIATEWTEEDCDVLIALHARRSHASVERFRQAYPNRPLVLALTGTDLYRDLRINSEGRHSLSLASHVVVLQGAALEELEDVVRSKTCVIYQSAAPPVRRAEPKEDCFEACVLSHLREVKDPLRAAFASRTLPDESRVCITHAGRALAPEWEQAAKAEERANPRYRWIGEQPHASALQLLARCRLLVLSSLMEGGANAIGEAVVCGVPVLCSDIRGNAGMLDADYPGYFRARDTGQLAQMLRRAETDPDFLARLREHIHKLQVRFAPEQEVASWHRLIQRLFSP